jgi:hypothetical protein
MCAVSTSVEMVIDNGMPVTDVSYRRNLTGRMKAQVTLANDAVSMAHDCGSVTLGAGA